MKLDLKYIFFRFLKCFRYYNLKYRTEWHELHEEDALVNKVTIINTNNPCGPCVDQIWPLHTGISRAGIILVKFSPKKAMKSWNSMYKVLVHLNKVHLITIFFYRNALERKLLIYGLIYGCYLDVLFWYFNIKLGHDVETLFINCQHFQLFGLMSRNETQYVDVEVDVAVKVKMINVIKRKCWRVRIIFLQNFAK